ncbi:hypothetical protein FA95DRAFT_1025259 [Auriscalpium vulgare]|uniref:Uncharacterized protein n=1 Tax=Auriscalpium vulgare TaxID=40419 RepID=A0ACB8RYL2_9AGAM|nr:hypothetical protein FA95DRAFT_1025259 [Auriscalpium vulgare]
MAKRDDVLAGFPPKISIDIPPAYQTDAKSPSATGSSPSTARSPAQGCQSPGRRRKSKNIRATVHDFLRECLTQQSPWSEEQCRAMLAQCAELCKGSKLDVSELIQEPFIEGRVLVYWAILKRSWQEGASSSDPAAADGLTMALLAESERTGIAPQTIEDVRHACVALSDDALFQRVRRRFHAFSPTLSGAEKMLLRSNGVSTDFVDTAYVVEGLGDGTTFSASLELPLFQLRMRVVKKLSVEFIANGRLWRLALDVDKGGVWRATLGIAAHSQKAYIDVVLSVKEVSPEANPSQCTPVAGSRYVSIALKSLLSPLVAGYKREVTQRLDATTMAAALQAKSTTYIDASGTLKAKLAGRVQSRKPPSEGDGCIIC